MDMLLWRWSSRGCNEWIETQAGLLWDIYKKQTVCLCP